MSVRVSMSSAPISACSGLMYSGVPTRTPSSREQGLLGQVMGRRLGHAEVDDLRHRAVVLDRHQDVRGLEVPVDDALLVGVLDTFADLREQVEALGRAEAVPVAVGR